MYRLLPSPIRRALELLDDSEAVAEAFEKDFISAKTVYGERVFISLYERAKAISEELEAYTPPDFLKIDDMYAKLKEQIAFEMKRYKVMAYISSDEAIAHATPKILETGEVIRLGNFDRLDETIELLSERGYHPSR